MYNNQRIGIVIPAHNEQSFIGDVIDTLPALVDRAYVVDDASTDGTWDEIQRHATAANTPQPSMAIPDGGSEFHRRVVPIRHTTNTGRGGAIKTGYRLALKDGMDAIAVIDGDGQMDPSILDQFLDPIVNGQADYAKGNRLLSADHRNGMSRWRLLGNTLLTYLTKIASGYWRMMDPQNGYTVVSADTLRSIDMDGLYEDYGFLNDMLVKLNVADARIVDISMHARYGTESSGIKYSSFIPKLSFLLLVNFIWRLKTKYLLFDFHPLVGLYILGSIGGLGGVVYFGWILGSELTPSRAAIGLIVFLFSGLLLTLAMIFDRAHNSRLESRIERGVR